MRPISGSPLRRRISISEDGRRPGEDGDPRKSIAERYAEREDYLTRYSAAIDGLVQQRWVLPEDRAALLHRGQQEWDEAVK